MSDMRDTALKSVVAAALLLGAGLAYAQSTTTPAPQTPDKPAASPPPAAKAPTDAKMTLTEKQAKSWIDKRVFSNDNKELGEVAAFKRSADDTVLEMHADIGGVLGIGETRVVVMPAQFKLQGDRVILNMSEEQAKALPKAKD
jgi:hypothetical protein